MPRVAGIDVPPQKRGEFALTAIFGVGRSRAREILAKAEIDPFVKTEDWTEDEVRRVRQILEDEYVVEGMLRTEIHLNIKRLSDIGCYRGLRHRKSLPVRGQRTHTNARGRKGRRVAIAGKKKVTK